MIKLLLLLTPPNHPRKKLQVVLSPLNVKTENTDLRSNLPKVPTFVRGRSQFHLSPSLQSPSTKDNTALIFNEFYIPITFE